MLKRFFQVVVGPQHDRLGEIFTPGYPRDQDDLTGRGMLFDVGQKVQAADMRHIDVRDQDVKPLAVKQLLGLTGIGGDLTVKAKLRNLIADQGADSRLVVHDQDAGYSDCQGNLLCSKPRPFKRASAWQHAMHPMDIASAHGNRCLKKTIQIFITICTICKAFHSYRFSFERLQAVPAILAKDVVHPPPKLPEESQKTIPTIVGTITAGQDCSVEYLNTHIP